MIFTFYSYKGGVGRTMALANIAHLFYQSGKRVLMIDWDIEAPGLEYYFKVHDTISAQKGLMDMVADYKDYIRTSRAQSMALSENRNEPARFPVLTDYMHNVFKNAPGEPAAGDIWLMTPGKRTDLELYERQVLNFDWQDFYEHWDGGLYLDGLYQELQEVADIVLIDSRTGLTEIGGICTYHLADVIVMFCTANDQNIQGTLDMARNFRRPEVVKARSGRHLDLLIVPSRIDDRTENTFVTELRDRLIQKLGGFASELKERFNELYIPYIPYFSYREDIASKNQSLGSEILIERYEIIKNRLAEYNQQTLKIDIDPSRIESLQDIHRDINHKASITDLSNLFRDFISQSTHSKKLIVSNNYEHQSITIIKDKQRGFIQQANSFLNSGQIDTAYHLYSDVIKGIWQYSLELHPEVEWNLRLIRMYQGWQDEVKETLTARIDSQKKKIDQLKTIHRLLTFVNHVPPIYQDLTQLNGRPEIPSAYKKYCAELEHYRNTLLTISKDGVVVIDPAIEIEIIRVALQAEQDYRFSEARSLLELVRDTDQARRASRRINQKLDHEGIDKIFQDIEDFEAQYDLGKAFDALDMLKDLRRRYPHYEIWQDHWLRIGRFEAEHLINQGISQFARISFDDIAGNNTIGKSLIHNAMGLFERARSVANIAREAEPNHQSLIDLQDESNMLYKITHQISEAIVSLDLDRSGDAKNVIEKSLQGTYKHFNFPIIYSIIGFFAQHINTIHEEKVSINKGKQNIAEGKYIEAYKLFNRHKHSLINSHNKIATEGSKTAKQGIPNEAYEQVKMIDQEFQFIVQELDIETSTFAFILDKLIQLRNDIPADVQDVHFIDTYIDEVARSQHSLDQSRTLYEKACEYRDQGQWYTGAELLKQIVNILGPNISSNVEKQQQVWQRINDDIANIMNSCSQFEMAANDTYISGDLHSSLSNVKKALDTIYYIEQHAKAHRGGITRNLIETKTSMEKLQDRINILKSILDLPRDEQLAHLYTLKQIDSQMEKLRTELEVERRERIESLFATIERHITQGSFDIAFESIQQLTALDPTDPRIDRLQERVKKQRIVKRNIDELETKGDTQSNYSESKYIYRQALDLILNEEHLLTPKFQSDIIDLMDIIEKDSIGLAKEESNMDDVFNQINIINSDPDIQGLTKQSIRILNKWARATCNNKLRSMTQSLMQIGDLQEACRIARKSYAFNPSDQQILSDYISTSQNFVEHICKLAEKRLILAQDHLSNPNGMVQAAIDVLERIETEIFKPVERDFPELIDLFDGDQSIEKLRQRIEQQLANARNLHALTQPVIMALEEAQASFGQNNLEQAKTLLIPYVDDVGLQAQAPLLAERVQTIYERVQKAEHALKVKDVRSLLATMPDKINDATATTDIEALLQPIQTLYRDVDAASVGEQLYNELKLLLKQASEHRTRLYSLAKWLASATRHKNNQNYPSAIHSYKQAIDLAIGSQRTDLELELLECQQHA